MTLGENIVRLRTQKNWSQGDLADALDISRQSVSKWETDASIPDLDKLLKLSELFGVTLDELVRGESTARTAAAPAAPDVSASFAPQAAPQREKRRTVTGTVLLCTGAIMLLLCLLFAGDLLAGLLFASPFLLCGVICLAVKRRAGLFCGWAVYVCLDLYFRIAAGLSWMTIFTTHLWTAQMNNVRYVSLAIAWVQFIGMILMILYTVRSYRTLKVSATKKEVTWLIVGWVAALVVLPLLMSYGVMPLWRDNLHNYSNFSPYFFINVLYSYVRLALVNVLLVRTLAVWRVKRDEKKANRNAAET